MVDKKLLMHAMIDAIENDLINYILLICDDLRCIPEDLINKAEERTSEKDLELYLRQLDLADFVKIIDKNIDKTELSLEEKKFIDREMKSIVPIRNRVMHPRPLEFHDFVMLENVFNNLSNKIKSIPWTKVINLKIMIDNKSEELLKIDLSGFKKTTNILENLPVPEFDDTTYIGREREISEIKKLIFDNQVKVLSIIGEGGVGKTATVVKILYDLLDDNQFDYEAIIWTSLKTQQLDKISFSQIENAIKNIQALKKSIENCIPTNENLSVEENIIAFTKEFKSIIVLDNLETINTKDIKDFIFELSKSSKIIITSRIGLGELEYRYELIGLNQRESLKYMHALLDYYGLNKILTDNEIRNIIAKELYSNPLSIKWFVRCLYSGMEINEILNNKQNIVYFCMNNVYEKLNSTSIGILSLLLIENRSLSHAEIAFYLNMSVENELEIRKSINEIYKSNFVDGNYNLNDNISLTKMSYDYLRLNHYPDKVFIDNVISKRKELSNIKQQMELKNEFDIFNPKAITSINSQERIISAKYLLDALNHSKNGDWQNAFSLVEMAKKVCPNYFEPYKISAFLYAIKKDQTAMNEYKMSIELCETPIEKSTVLVLLGNYCLEQDERIDAVDYFNAAESLYNHPYINLCNSKALTYLGKYDAALEEINKIDFDKLPTTKYKNMYLTRKADIFLRKSQVDGNKNPERSFELIKVAISILESSPSGDYKLWNVYANALFSLSLFYYKKNIMDYVIDKIKSKYNYLRKSSKYKTLCNLLSNRFELISNPRKKELLIYIFDYKDLIEKLPNDNYGIIIHMENGFGFIACKKNNHNLYFNYDSKDVFDIGSVVSFKIKKTSEDKIIATNIVKKSNIEDFYLKSNSINQHTFSGETDD